MESPLIANGAELSRIGGFVTIAKIERKVQAPRKNIIISAGSSQIKLKYCNNISRAWWRCG